MEIINLFWTGGLDSTYRVCELSKLDVEIRPIYFSFPFRSSTDCELRAIEKISALIRSRSDTRAILRPLTIVRMEEIEEDMEICKAYEWVREHTIVEYGLKRFPKQYLYLASYCRQKGIECEIGTEYEPRCRVHQVLQNAVLNEFDTGVVRYYKIDASKTEHHISTLLKYFHFPIPLYHMSKIEELNAYREWKAEDILSQTWFCHHPINGEPCGYCSPCRQVVAGNMAFRLPKAARWRHRFAYVFLLWSDKILPKLRKIK